MIRSALLATAMIAAGTATAAQECAAIEHDIARLRCFDEAAQATEPAAPQGWTSTRETDPVTDTIRTTITVPAATIPECGSHRAPPQLEVICIDSTDVWFVRVRQPCYLGIEKQFSFTTRFDDMQAFSQTFSAAPKNGDFQVSVSTAADLIRRMTSASHYLIRVEPQNDYPFVLDFPVAKLAAAIDASGAQCSLK
ncbi:type VI secretion system (T6SS) VasI/EvfG family protein [Gemmobacter caeni]|uniref:Type VI secretion system (T6SS) VasI/EvfG family protein n=1 Tax=Gemmobacter caeni TaxID=589035 RepID=A0A2T5ZYC4_9RHOB|nr:type VI secretion system-associated protein TagO [Gemmobacter caeni]PTX36570.1 type VI secretion system (T6SS) VasI/EvfG family protein [Gemmobacter caeni]TWI87732.1 type VI secretion system (T6SS) VasI/EvfG family protein [Gemmobacter caeni]